MVDAEIAHSLFVILFGLVKSSFLFLSYKITFLFLSPFILSLYLAFSTFSLSSALHSAFSVPPPPTPRPSLSLSPSLSLLLSPPRRQSIYLSVHLSVLVPFCFQSVCFGDLPTVGLSTAEGFGFFLNQKTKKLLIQMFCCKTVKQMTSSDPDFI